MATVHLVPIADDVEHLIPGGWDGHGADCPDCLRGRWLLLEIDPSVEEVDCSCGPASELVPNDNGPDGWLITHHSIDGREQREETSA